MPDGAPPRDASPQDSESPPAAPQPLAGVRVLELARVLAGPWAGQILADLGADVVKLESPSGDETRQWGPPFVRHNNDGGADESDDDNDGAAGGQTAAYFYCCNRGKRSVAVDLKSDDGRRRAQALAAKADVIVENFKVGGLAQYGLDYDNARRANARVVYCAISGFGQSGARARQPGYDFLAQGLGGVMSVTGAADGEPQKVGVAFMDLFTGVYAAVAILAALRERGRSGRGAYLDLALLDSAVAVMANQAQNYLATGAAPRRMGNAHPNIAPYELYAAADGAVIITVGNDRQFERLRGVLGLAADARFASNGLRVANRAALAEAIGARLRAWRARDFLAAAEAAGVPAAPVNDMAGVFAEPQVRHRGMQISVGGAPGVRLPILFDGAAAVAPRPAPRLGEHTDEVFADWLG